MSHFLLVLQGPSGADEALRGVKPFFGEASGELGRTRVPFDLLLFAQPFLEETGVFIKIE